MGAKTALLDFAEGDIRPPLLGATCSDRTEVEELVREIDPGYLVRSAGDGTLRNDLYPPNEIVYATVLAGAEFGIPLYGTMAHSFIEAHASENGAFESFARSNPQNVTLLIDTYDTETAAAKGLHLAMRVVAKGPHLMTWRTVGARRLSLSCSM